MTKSHLLSTTIPYVNAPPHIGFAYELVLADALARYHRLRGRCVHFQTGTDENAFKNVLSARPLGVPVQEFVTQNSERFRSLCHGLSLSHDQFVRTSDAAHHRAVQAFLSQLRPDDVYEQEWRGLYCAGCEDFYQPHELVDATCPDHQSPLVEIAERNWFFRLSRYQDRLREHIASGRIQIVPQSRALEVLRFIDQGLTNISLSRNAERSAGWGIPFPGDDQQVVYVWIDALVNYLTGQGYPDSDWSRRYWGDAAVKTHVIGKNVWKFHAVYWQALLLSAGIEVPDRILVHGFLTSEGRKISKSDGNATDPSVYVQQFGADAVRFFLLRHIHPFEDTDFSVERLVTSYHADLSNGIGNLCSRLTTLAESASLPGVRRAGTPQAPPGLAEHVAGYRLDLAAEVLLAEVRQLNQLLSHEQPWTHLKAGRRDEASRTLGHVAARLDSVAWWLQPFLPVTATMIRSALAVPLIKAISPLFPRLR